MNIQQWMKTYVKCVKKAFGSRIRFIGLQGSYGRGEQTVNSDIDVVLIIDRLSAADLDLYMHAVSALPQRDKLCGFVCGYDELLCWDKADLLSLCFDAGAVEGSLDPLLALIGPEDIRRSIHASCCAIYHSCCHNYLHKRSESIISELQKSVFFTLRTEHYLHTGRFIKKKSDLIKTLNSKQRELLTAAGFNGVSAAIFSWSGEMIQKYKTQ